MKCPKCGGRADVTHNRAFPDYVRRRRVCRECGEVFSTYEMLKPDGLRYITRTAQPKREKPKSCGFNHAIACEDGSLCATCVWSPIKRRDIG